MDLSEDELVSRPKSIQSTKRTPLYCYQLSEQWKLFVRPQWRNSPCVRVSDRKRRSASTKLYTNLSKREVPQAANNSQRHVSVSIFSSSEAFLKKINENPKELNICDLCQWQYFALFRMSLIDPLSGSGPVTLKKDTDEYFSDVKFSLQNEDMTILCRGLSGMSHIFAIPSM